MKLLFLLVATMLAGAISVSAQTDCPHPSGCVVISGDAARAALEAGDKVKALEVENKDLKEKVIPTLKDALNDMRVEFARCSGEATILKQRAASDAAMLELMMKLVRPKKIALVNVF